MAFGGIFKLQDTYGLPLLLIWKKLCDSRFSVSYEQFLLDTRGNGWSDETTALIWKKLNEMGSVIAWNKVRCVIAWDKYVSDARAHGWSDQKILAAIAEVAHFGYGGEEGREFLKRMELMMRLPGCTDEGRQTQ